MGCVVAGPLSNRYGRKKTLLLTALVFLASSLGCALSASLPAFIAFRVVAGIAVGAASMLAPIYIAEMAPPRHRGKLVSLNLFAIFLGQSSAFYSNYFLRDFGGAANWRWMLAVMAVPSFLLFAALLFAPESPRWLIGKRQYQPALQILTRINGAKDADLELNDILDSMQNETRGKFAECFRHGTRTCFDPWNSARGLSASHRHQCRHVLRAVHLQVGGIRQQLSALSNRIDGHGQSDLLRGVHVLCR